MQFDFENILLVVFIYYATQSLIFIFGLFKNNHTKYENILFKVSVVVAARNEENNISHCLDSLLKLNYPKELLEIIVINDSSTDNTLNILQKYSLNNSNLKIFNVPKREILIGKSNAIDFGIENSSGEIIMMTDADCVVNQNWILTTIKYFDDKIGIVAGMTLQKSNSCFTGMQSLDWAFLLGIGSAGINLKMPFSIIGNNFSVRRKTYDEVGGYKNIKFSVTEDFALFKKMIESTHWIAKFPIEENNLIKSNPCENFSDLIKQKKRWGIGGLDMKLSGLSIMFSGFLMHLFFVLTPFFSNQIIFSSVILSSKIILDFIFVFLVLRKLNELHQLKYFICFELYFIFYVIILPFVVFFTGKLEWKGRKY